MHINIVPSWHFQDESGKRLHNQLLALLSAVDQHRRLTAAARDIGMSYRHAWNILNDSEQLLGNPLVLMERGRGARLTPLGQKLLWSNQRIEARLHPQMESLATELNVELHRAMADLTPVIRIYASHGYAVALIPEHSQGYQVEMHYQSPQEALLALNQGRCKIAGFHQSIGLEIPAQKSRYMELLEPSKFGIIRFVRRQQGLIFSPEREQAINSISDLKAGSLKFINRQKGSGTRELFEQLIEQQQIDKAEINGYEDQEYTHSAIAAYIASGMADVGFGVQAAAHRFKLAFTPVIQEYYLWAYPLESEQDEDIQAFLETLRNPLLQDNLNQLPGYRADHCGETTTSDWLFDQ